MFFGGFFQYTLCVRFFFFALLRIPAGLFVSISASVFFFLSWTFSELLDGV